MIDAIVEYFSTMISSIVEYISNINFDEAFDSVKMLVGNLDTDLLKDTVDSVVELVQGLFN